MFTVLLANGGSVKTETATLGPGGVLICETINKRDGKRVETLYAPDQWKTVTHELD